MLLKWPFSGISYCTVWVKTDRRSGETTASTLEVEAFTLNGVEASNLAYPEVIVDFLTLQIKDETAG
jgi:hypothetical protein